MLLSAAPVTAVLFCLSLTQEHKSIFSLSLCWECGKKPQLNETTSHFLSVHWSCSVPLFQSVLFFLSHFGALDSYTGEASQNSPSCSFYLRIISSYCSVYHNCWCFRTWATSLKKENTHWMQNSTRQ